MTIDPQLGGATIVENGIPGLILPAGYLGSTLMGACFVLAGFDTLVAKIMSFVLAVGLIAPLSLVRDKLCVPRVGAAAPSSPACSPSVYRPTWNILGVLYVG